MEAPRDFMRPYGWNTPEEMELSITGSAQLGQADFHKLPRSKGRRLEERTRGLVNMAEQAQDEPRGPLSQDIVYGPNYSPPWVPLQDTLGVTGRPEDSMRFVGPAYGNAAFQERTVLQSSSDVPHALADQDLLDVSIFPRDAGLSGYPWNYVRSHDASVMSRNAPDRSNLKQADAFSCQAITTVENLAHGNSPCGVASFAPSEGLDFHGQSMQEVMPGSSRPSAVSSYDRLSYPDSRSDFVMVPSPTTSDISQVSARGPDVFCAYLGPGDLRLGEQSQTAPFWKETGVSAAASNAAAMFHHGAYNPPGGSTSSSEKTGNELWHRVLDTPEQPEGFSSRSVPSRHPIFGDRGDHEPSLTGAGPHAHQGLSHGTLGSQSQSHHG